MRPTPTLHATGGRRLFKSGRSLVPARRLPGSKTIHGRGDPFDEDKAFQRVSMDPRNLYNFWQRQIGPLKGQYDFRRTRDTVFMNQHYSKKQVLTHWGADKNERHFKKWYLPSQLPLIVPSPLTSPRLNPKATSVTRYSRPGKEGGRQAADEEEMMRFFAGQAPTYPLMFREYERRMDHVLLRSLFVGNLKQAHHLIKTGNVRLNGRIERQPALRLLPGDFLEVNPSSIPWLRRPTIKEIGLAHPNSRGAEWDIKDAWRTLLTDVQGFSVEDASRLIEEAQQADEGKTEDELRAAEEERNAQSVKEREAAKEASQRDWERRLRKLTGRTEDDADAERAEAREERELAEEAEERAAVEAEEVETPQTEEEAEKLAARLDAEEDVLDAAEEASSSSSSSADGLTSADSTSTEVDFPSSRPWRPTSLALDDLPELASAPERHPPKEPKALTPTHFPAYTTDPEGARDFALPPWSAPWLFVPGYVQPNFAYCTITYLRHPTARHNYCEIPSPFDPKGDLLRSAWEWWQRRRARRRVYVGGLYPGGIDARARSPATRGEGRGPQWYRTGVHEEYY